MRAAARRSTWRCARHFTHLPLALLLFSLGAFPVQAGPAGHAGAAPRAGTSSWRARLVVIFPEGAPTWGPPMSEFRQGVGHLALTPGRDGGARGAVGCSTGCCAAGGRSARGPVRVAFGPPVPVSPEDGTRRERAAALTADVRGAVAALLDADGAAAYP